MNQSKTGRISAQTKEYLSCLATRVETNGPAGYEQRNVGQMCHALVCRHYVLNIFGTLTQKVEILHI